MLTARYTEVQAASLAVPCPILQARTLFKKHSKTSQTKVQMILRTHP